MPALKLTESEQRLLAQWKSAEERWPRRRWYLLLVSVLLTIAYTFLFFTFHALVFRDVTDDSMPVRAGVSAMVSPLLWFGLGSGVYWVGLTIKNWNGNAQRRLLLKVISAVES
jgi:hypothetical protein